MQKRSSLPPSRPRQPLSTPPGAVRRSGRSRRFRSRGAAILTISLLVAILLLFGIGLMLWVVQGGAAFAPTPTPTATLAPRPTATADFGATRVAEDFATQEAFRVAIATNAAETPMAPESPEAPDTSAQATPLPAEIETPSAVGPTAVATGDAAPVTIDGLITSVPSTPTATPVSFSAVDTPLPTDTPASGTTLNMPIISNEQPPPPPTETPSATPSPTVTPSPTAILAPAATPTLAQPPTATATQVINLPATETPTAAATVAPPTSTPLPLTPTPVYAVSSLNARTRAEGALLRPGPSNFYTQTVAIGGNIDVKIYGRDATGEWVYVCCIDNDLGWVRQAYAQPTGNVLPEGAPEEINPNDVRWLPVQPLGPAIGALPLATAIPANDFPMLRYSPSNQASVPARPNPPIQFAWPNLPTAGQGFVSPAIVGGNSVLAASADNHLYSLDRLGGTQRWRYDLGRVIRFAPLFQDSAVYVAADNGALVALDDGGNAATLKWEMSLGMPAVSSFNVFSGTLYIGGANGDDHRIFAIRQADGAIRNSYGINGPGLQYPAIGNQMIFIGDGRVDAVDVNLVEVVWTRGDISGVAAPPVYGWPGVAALAELVVADGAGRLHNLDANTGRDLWTYQGSEPIKGLALSKASVLVTGDAYVKAISRDEGKELWRTGVSGPILGGPVTSNNQVIVISQSGSVQFLDVTSGVQVSSISIDTPAGGPGAVSGEWIFVPGANGGMYGLRGKQ